MSYRGIYHVVVLISWYGIIPYRMRETAELERSELRRRHDVEVRATSSYNKLRPVAVRRYGIGRSDKGYESVAYARGWYLLARKQNTVRRPRVQYSTKKVA